MFVQALERPREGEDRHLKGFLLCFPTPLTPCCMSSRRAAKCHLPSHCFSATDASALYLYISHAHHNRKSIHYTPEERQASCCIHVALQGQCMEKVQVATCASYSCCVSSFIVYLAEIVQHNLHHNMHHDMQHNLHHNLHHNMHHVLLLLGNI